MIQALVGKKVEQTQRFLADGKRIPVTILAVPKTQVTQIKTIEKDGYAAVQIGVGTKKKPSKALVGHVRKANMKDAPMSLREVKVVSDDSTLALGDGINASDVLKIGDIVKASGTNKGKGFQGGVRRHGFKGGPRTHGQSDRERAPGSIGQTTTPGRVYKGKRMAGHMGTEEVTIKNLVVVAVNGDQILLKGLVPGSINSLVYIEKTGELKNPFELYKTDEEKAAESSSAEASEDKQEISEEIPTPEAQSEEPKQAQSVEEPVKEEAEEVKSEAVVPTPADTEAMAGKPAEEPAKEEVKETAEAKEEKEEK